MRGKNVVITEADYDRLTGLVQSRERRAAYGPLAANLEHELVHGKVVPPDSVPKGVVTMHSKVRIRDLETNEREAYTLVYPEEADITKGYLSVLAPLGTALLGAKVGAILEVHAPGGLHRIKVDKILYQPEAAGDYHL